MTKEENEKRLARLKAIVSNLPDKPGSYQYYDAVSYTHLTLPTNREV